MYIIRMKESNPHWESLHTTQISIPIGLMKQWVNKSNVSFSAQDLACCFSWLADIRQAAPTQFSLKVWMGCRVSASCVQRKHPRTPTNHPSNNNINSRGSTDKKKAILHSDNFVWMPWETWIATKNPHKHTHVRTLPALINSNLIYGPLAYSLQLHLSWFANTAFVMGVMGNASHFSCQDKFDSWACERAGAEIWMTVAGAGLFFSPGVSLTTCGHGFEAKCANWWKLLTNVITLIIHSFISFSYFNTTTLFHEIF